MVVDVRQGASVVKAAVRTHGRVISSEEALQAIHALVDPQVRTEFLFDKAETETDKK